MDIVAVGYAGWEGTLRILDEESLRKRLSDRYDPRFWERLYMAPEDYQEGSGAEALRQRFCALSEEGLCEDGGDGGVLAALWRLLKRNGYGGTYSLRAFPVLQQTIEVCEMFALNPYRLYAPGCRLLLAENAGEILREAAGAGVPSAVCGYTAGGVAVWRTDTDRPSSLRRPERDELWKVLPKESKIS